MNGTIPIPLRVRIRTHVPVFAAAELPFATGHLPSPASVASVPMATPDVTQCAWSPPWPAHWSATLRIVPQFPAARSQIANVWFAEYVVEPATAVLHVQSHPCAGGARSRGAY